MCILLTIRQAKFRIYRYISIKFTCFHFMKFSNLMLINHRSLTRAVVTLTGLPYSVLYTTPCRNWKDGYDGDDVFSHKVSEAVMLQVKKETDIFIFIDLFNGKTWRYGLFLLLTTAHLFFLTSKFCFSIRSKGWSQFSSSLFSQDFSSKAGACVNMSSQVCIMSETERHACHIYIHAQLQVWGQYRFNILFLFWKKWIPTFSKDKLNW